MRLSELIASLQALKDAHGDLDVTVPDTTNADDEFDPHVDHPAVAFARLSRPEDFSDPADSDPRIILEVEGSKI